jgi:type II secretory pathway predicted ATPase ExeA
VNTKMLALYGLTWNPFAPDVPVEALHISRRFESFRWRVEQLLGEGGFALVAGAPGTGKSVTLRIFSERLGGQRDVKIVSSAGPRPASPTSIARWATCSASSWPRTTGGPVPSCCAIAGRRISTPHCRDPC